MGFSRTEPHGVCSSHQCSDAGVQHGAACKLVYPGAWRAVLEERLYVHRTYPGGMVGSTRPSSSPAHHGPQGSMCCMFLSPTHGRNRRCMPSSIPHNHGRNRGVCATCPHPKENREFYAQHASLTLRSIASSLRSMPPSLRRIASSMRRGLLPLRRIASSMRRGLSP